MQQLMWRMLAAVMLSLTSTVTAQEPVCLDGQLRQPGAFVQYCYNGEWRWICNQDSNWNQQRTNDACTQLGYTYEQNESGTSSEVCITTTQQPRGVVTLTNCIGPGLTQCTVTPSDTCTTCSHVLLDCTTGRSSCVTGSLRLVGGSTEREGRVEVCVGNRWRTVCTETPQLLAGAVCSLFDHTFEESAVSAVDTFSRGAVPEYGLNCVLNPTEGWVCMPIMEQCSSPVELGVVCKNSEYLKNESSMGTMQLTSTSPVFTDRPVDVSACTSDAGLISVVVILTVSLVATLVVLVITCAVLIKNHKQRLLANETCEEVVVPNTAANPAYMTVTSNDDNHTYDVINDVMASKQRRGN